MSQKTTKKESEGKAPLVCTFGKCKQLQAEDGEFCERHQGNIKGNIKCDCGARFWGMTGKEDTCQKCLKKVLKK